jgi:ribosomal-protein-alanine N-acetyltransferase
VNSREECAADAEIRLCRGDDVDALGRFFAQLDEDPAAAGFRPHPMSAEHARWICGREQSRDVYAVAIRGAEVVGYGMLRGWDEGYSVPSLGIAVLSSARGTGISTAMMRFLHHEAARAGSTRVRLRVEASNDRARRLYARLGYAETGEERGQLVMERLLDDTDREP